VAIRFFSVYFFEQIVINVPLIFSLLMVSVMMWQHYGELGLLGMILMMNGQNWNQIFQPHVMSVGTISFCLHVE
jgi:hypothetical protein